MGLRLCGGSVLDLDVSIIILSVSCMLCAWLIRTWGLLGVECMLCGCPWGDVSDIVSSNNPEYRVCRLKNARRGEEVMMWSVISFIAPMERKQQW